jgi:ATP-dependent Clp endopeptidase proteolytic subunit ClpP
MNEGHIWVDKEMSETFHNEVSSKLSLPANQQASEITLHIQSPGGNVYAGYNAYHMLKLSGKKIISRIEGEAQSMATFLSLAGDEVEIYNPSVYMIHFPQAGIQGTADDMESGASSLRNIENDMAQAYLMKNQKSYAKDPSVELLSLEQVKEMMRKETSLTAYQAKKYGFVDRVIDPLRAVAIGKPIKMETNKLQDAFNTFKAKMEAVINEVLPKAEVPAEPMKEEEKEVKSMALPAGEYPMQDGSVIVVDETGMIIEVKPAMPMETKDQKMIKALQAELETIKSAAATSEQKATTAAQALGKIQEEFEGLRKISVGGDSAPKAAAQFTKTPVMQENDNDSAMREEIFAHAGLGWIKNVKQKQN